jgi:hypothetical protein
MPKEPTTPTADLINALAEFENVKGNKINPAFSTATKKSMYVSLDALLEAIKPILHKNNLAMIQSLISEEGKVGIETSFLHTSGQSFAFGKLMVKSENLTPQQIGSSLTFLKRQSIQTACGISVDLDDDGNRASNTPMPQAAGAPLTYKQSSIPGTNNVR